MGESRIELGLAGDQLTVLGSRFIRKAVAGGHSPNYPDGREAGHKFSIGTISDGIQAVVTVEQMQFPFSTNPRTIVIAQTIGSQLTVGEVVQPPVKEFSEVVALAIGYAESAIAADAIMQRVRSGIPPIE